MANNDIITSSQKFVEENRSAFAEVISSDIDIDAFIAAVTTALALNKDVVEKCTAESIKKSCAKAAYDGIRPDGKEGALVPYWNSTLKCMEAQYMPMVYGIRKKARKHDDIIIDATVVYKNDGFTVVLGDDPRIEHVPAPMDAEPGEIIAAYAIFRKGDLILHREILRKSDLESIRAAASDKSPAWRQWPGEMSRKAAVHRGAKSVPMSDAVRQLIDRDNELYDVGANAKDVTPKNVSLAGRFGGRSSGGFDPNNVKQLENNGQQGMDRINPSTGEVIEADRETSARSTASKTKDEGAAGAQNTERLSANQFSDYGKALLRVANPENLKATHDAFWKGKPPQTGPDYELARSIYGVHSERLKNGGDAQGAISAVTNLIEKDFPL